MPKQFTKDITNLAEQLDDMRDNVEWINAHYETLIDLTAQALTFIAKEHGQSIVVNDFMEPFGYKVDPATWLEVWDKIDKPWRS